MSNSPGVVADGWQREDRSSYSAPSIGRRYPSWALIDDPSSRNEPAKRPINLELVVTRERVLPAGKVPLRQLPPVMALTDIADHLLAGHKVVFYLDVALLLVARALFDVEQAGDPKRALPLVLGNRRGDSAALT